MEVVMVWVVLWAGSAGWFLVALGLEL